MAIKISGTTVVDDSRNLVNLNSGAIVGVQSAGSVVGAGATTINFIGAGNTFNYNPSTKTLDISIQGGGGGGVSTTGILSCRAIANSALLFENLELTDSFGHGTNYAMVGPITIVGAGTTIIVGAGTTYVII